MTTVALWRIAATTATYEAHDMTGAGAKSTGGRWNSAGLALIYSSESIALAVHETIVHLRSGGLPLNRYLVRIDVPITVWNKRTILDPAPVGWDALPAAMTSRNVGDAWLKAPSSPALLVVPSIIVPEESNILINPLHPDSATIKANSLRRWIYDPRFF